MSRVLWIMIGALFASAAAMSIEVHHAPTMHMVDQPRCWPRGVDVPHSEMTGCPDEYDDERVDI